MPATILYSYFILWRYHKEYIDNHYITHVNTGIVRFKRSIVFVRHKLQYKNLLIESRMFSLLDRFSCNDRSYFLHMLTANNTATIRASRLKVSTAWKSLGKLQSFRLIQYICSWIFAKAPKRQPIVTYCSIHIE